MYLGKLKIFNPHQHEQDRAKLLDVKTNATWLAFTELDGLINNSALARQYFNKTLGWFSQKLNGCTVCNKKRSFTESEYHQLAEAFRHIAKRLEVHADEIDAAAMEADDGK